MIFLDTETYSEVPIKHGTYKYAANCEVMIVTYAWDEGPVEIWDLTRSKKMPDDLDYLLNDCDDQVCVHNSIFDINVLKLSRNLRIELSEDRWLDSMVQALAHSMPGALGKLCEILNVEQDERKDKAGKKLIHLFCKPQADGSRANRFTHPKQWDEFCEYAMSDISAMRAVHKILPMWNYTGNEYALWLLDRKINSRGICIDLDLSRSAIRAVDAAQRRLAGRTAELTAGEVSSATKRDALLAHILKEYGVDLPDMQASTLERRIDDPDLPWQLRELLAIRLQATTSSTAKYNALMRMVSDDGRLRGTQQFNGANRTGRWGHRGFQPGNMPRPDMEPEEIDIAIEALKDDCADLMYDNVMRVTSNCIRGVIVAPPGKKLVVSDLSNIEGRKAAWYAGEEWKLRAFRDFDAGIGSDLYKVAYGRAFNVEPESVNKKDRQIGKVMELFFQYQGGVGAFLTGAMTYQIDLEDMAQRGYETIPGDVLKEAEGFHEWMESEGRSTYGISKDVFVVCDSYKRLWRARHPLLVLMWKQIEEAVRLAITQPGTTVPCGKFKMRRDGAWLRVQLPSGRYLCYPSPRVNDKGAISYMGVNQYTKKWSRIFTYGGKLFENLCQAGARDVMTYNMPHIEDRGYEIVLTIHDEVITEAPDRSEFNDEHLSSLLARVPLWAPGLPLAADGFTGYRYRKG